MRKHLKRAIVAFYLVEYSGIDYALTDTVGKLI